MGSVASVAIVCAGLFTAAAGGTGVFAFWLLRGMYNSIQALPPTAEMLADSDSCVLFRYLPMLRARVAWRPLGVFPTPVHTATLPLSNSKRTFYLKREDLSSPRYGGNKVRTLQHQVAACEVHLAATPDAKFICIGSAGSNQTVAAAVHGAHLPIYPCYYKVDAPDLDNTINVLSALSFNPAKVFFWRHKLQMLCALVSAVFFNANKVFFLGGNNVLGVLGQIGAVLELAEQIQAGDAPDVDELYVAVGSSCTLTGLVLGVVLARHLGLRAFERANFKIVAVPIHHGSAKLSRSLSLYTAAWAAFVPLTPRFGIRSTAAFLVKNGVSVDLEPLAVAFLTSHVEVVADADLIGEYGAHSARSAVAAAFDAHLDVRGDVPAWLAKEKAPQPWLCGHFVAKPFALLLERMEAAPVDDKTVRLLWQTKSLVQPKGPSDEWPRFQELAASCPIFRDWAMRGRASSVLRRGHVNVDQDSRKSYQTLMTELA
ncbi:hypothetical protein SDRG_13301 [Saprolegnia diclina VS20]|uniref:Tryptophan synthase beta chain-like PALP domain-containing protein n=1 Tax=Saprolegnia diclina (strain VS20) TaxID=1156394 RepID=T0PU04_SAPDV|nr:hypothetical protein SDRG_13301 [Saprolegnia diclina VS20]EQC28964.1 hypothetical protein SDRG_13301 [Saprolegnia diclina VS20]|eukprot:XP_008617603.1 hypothetical protein SDRG_13301 [Saprolegnia diclina VS20]